MTMKGYVMNEKDRNAVLLVLLLTYACCWAYFPVVTFFVTISPIIFLGAFVIIGLIARAVGAILLWILTPVMNRAVYGKDD